MGFLGAFLRRVGERACASNVWRVATTDQVLLSLARNMEITAKSTGGFRVDFVRSRLTFVVPLTDKAMDRRGGHWIDASLQLESVCPRHVVNVLFHRIADGVCSEIS